MQFFTTDTVLHEVDLHHIHIAEIVEVVVLVPYVGNTSRHTCREVTSRLTEYDDPSTCHILTAMVTSTLQDGNGSRVTDTETLSDLTIDIHLTGGGTIESCVAGNDIFLSGKVRTGRRQDGDTSSTQSFGEVIVCLAFQFEGDTMCQKGTE